MILKKIWRKIYRRIVKFAIHFVLHRRFRSVNREALGLGQADLTKPEEKMVKDVWGGC